MSPIKESRAEQGNLPTQTAYMFFLGGQICSLVGDGIAILAIPLLVLQISHNPLAAALATMPRIIGTLVIGLPAGALIDRLNPRVVMLLMDALRAGIFVVLAACAAAHVLTIWIVLGLAFLAAGGGVCFDTSLTIVIQDVVAVDRLVQANSYLEGSRQASLVVGPGIAGILAATTGLEFGLLINAATFIVSFATVFCMPRSSSSTARHASSLASAMINLRSDLVEGARFLRSKRSLLVITFLQAAANLFIAVEGMLVFYVKEFLHLADGAVSTVVAAGGVGGILGAVAAPKLGRSELQNSVIAGGVLCLGCATAGTGLTTKLSVLVVLNLLVGASSVVVVVIVRANRQRVVPREFLGRVSATARVAALSAYPVGSMIAGFLTEKNHGNPRPVFFWSGIIAICITVVAWFAGMRNRSQSDTRLDIS